MRTSGRTPESGLNVQAKPERLAALLRANQNLLSKIKAKSENRARLIEKLRTMATTALGMLELVYLKMERLDQKDHAVRRAALAPATTTGRRTGRWDIYAELQRTGLLSFRSPARASKKLDAESAAPILDLGALS